MKRTMMDAIAEARGERLPILAEHGPKCAGGLSSRPTKTETVRLSGAATGADSGSAPARRT